MSQDRIVIVGASLAGGTAAVALRNEGFAGAITLIGAEHSTPYERPPLTKQFMQGKQPEPDWVLGDGSADRWSELDIELRLSTRAVAVDVVEKSVVLQTGGAVDYDRLVLATGAEPVRPELAGIDLPGVFTLRSWPDASAVRSAALSAGRAVVVGGSWIGTEVAASLRQQGCEVDLVEQAPYLLPRLGSSELGDRLAELHRDHGVVVHTGAAVASFRGSDAVESVVLEEGSLDTTVVLVATGVAPDLTIARSAGLREESKGIAVDGRFRTSVQDVYAIGDLAAVEHALYGTHARVEHWDVAKRHGAYVAKVLTGFDEAYAKPPLFFSDQYDLGFEYRGWINPAGPTPEVVVRGDDLAGSWYVFWLVEGSVHAVLNANAWDDGDALWAIAQQQPRVSIERLQNESVSIADLVR